LIRQVFRALPRPPQRISGNAPSLPASELYETLPEDHRLPYDVERIIGAVFDSGDYLEFQPEHAPEMVCAQARLNGHPVALVANRRGFLKTGAGARIGGIIYTESARKVAYFVDNAERQGWPILYLQDVSGFMVGSEAEASGIIRAGAEMVETMSCATVPKIVLTLNHASGAGYYAMAGQGFDPHFTLGWPTARIGVMEGESAVQAVFGPEIEKHKVTGQPLPPEIERQIAQTRADYDRWLDSTFAAARGHVDALIDPLETRQTLAFLLEVTLENPNRRPLALETLNS
jgi:acetyl-CoA carboxylase carboxyltransferase component